MAARRLSCILIAAFGLASACEGGAASSVSTEGGEDEAETDAATTTASTGDAEPEAAPGIVVDLAWVQARLGDPELQLVDTRAAFDGGHIPGAVPLAPAQLATTVDGVAAQIMPVADAEAVLGAAGLREGTTVVVYGEAPEYDPARIVWALHHYGHGEVHYLDGGFAAWVAAGGPVDPGDPVAQPGAYAIAGTDDAVRVTGAFVLEQLGEVPYDTAAIDLVDARSPDEYVAGRIPTAVNVPWSDLLADGRLRAPDELATRFEGVDPERTTVTYCLAGWRASVAWLALRHLGHSDVRVYDGSWNEWGAGGFPVEPGG